MWTQLQQWTKKALMSFQFFKVYIFGKCLKGRLFKTWTQLWANLQIHPILQGLLVFSSTHFAYHCGHWGFTNSPGFWKENLQDESTKQIPLSLGHPQTVFTPSLPLTWTNSQPPWTAAGVKSSLPDVLLVFCTFPVSYPPTCILHSLQINLIVQSSDMSCAFTYSFM